MEFKKITNTELVNLQNCDQEPIHVPGSIQTHGCLMAFSRNNLTIEYVSENTARYLGLLPAQLLGKPVQEVLHQTDEATWRAVFNTQKGYHFFQASVGTHQLGVVAHLAGSHVILDIEPKTTEISDNDYIDLYRGFVEDIENSFTINELSQQASDVIQRLTGYDRVMIYRFDEQYNGEVIAETKRPDLEGFLGLHYPHTDIPVQARELYLKNQLRIIVDMDYVPVPILTHQADATNQSLDLSLSVLRSVSPIHVAYLKNMGVSATLTISLLHKGRLWGLVACHHYSPKYLSYAIRTAAKLFGYFITSQIDTRLANEELAEAKQVHAAADTLAILELPFTTEAYTMLIDNPMILQLANAQGACLIVNGVHYCHGLQLPAAVLEALVAALKSRFGMLQKQVVMHDVALQFPEIGLAEHRVFGINYISLDSSPDDFIIWFREETIEEVNWAGDPAKAIEKDAGGLSPRKSFDLWKESVKHNSKRWSESEQWATLKFSTILSKYVFTINLKKEEEKQRLMSLALKQANSELENINWISTHDLQEPLRKIQVMSSKILGEADHQLSEKLTLQLYRVSESSKRARELIQEISRYAHTGSVQEAMHELSTAELLAEVLDTLVEEIQESGAELAVGPLPVISGSRFLIRQVFNNLLTNSIKFRRKEVPLRITVKLVSKTADLPDEVRAQATQYHIIALEDNGIGFAAEQNEKIFLPFRRLHSREEYAGAGIGLALCRRIMFRHGGLIFASGRLGQGATFYILFPKKANDFLME